MQNSKKIKYNLIIGVAGQFLTIALGIVLPRLVLTSYGSEVNGLINSVTQIYSYVGLLEAGIGTATIQALYKCIGSDDRNQTNAVLAATNRYYNKTGVLYAFAIVVFAVAYPLLVKTSLPIATVVLVIIFNGAGSVVGFFVQQKYLLLLRAEGKHYVDSILTTTITVIRNVAKILLMAMGMDVVWVQMIAMVIGLIQMVCITVYVKKNYKWIDLKVKPDYAAISQSKNVLIHQVSTLVFNNTDTIILTVFCGLKVVSVYSLYTLLFGMISNTLSVVVTSIVFAIGQAYHSDKERFQRLYDAYELGYMTLVFALYSVANFFILPFIKCYTAGVTDIEYIDSRLPLLFICTYLLSCGRSAPGQAINIAGHFKDTQSRSIFESVLNLTISLVAVQFLGIYGVLIGTIAALVYRANDMILYASHRILNRKARITYKRWIVNTVVFIGILFLNRYITVDLSSYGRIVLFCIPYTAGTLLIFFGVALLTNRETARDLLGLLQSMLGKNKKQG